LKIKTKDELINIIKQVKDNQDLNYLDISGLTDLSDLFNKSTFNGDISKWNTSNVTDMSSLFENSNFDGGIEDWKVSNVTKMKNIFEKTKIDVLKEINKWDINKAVGVSDLSPTTKITKEIKRRYDIRIKGSKLISIFTKFILI